MFQQFLKIVNYSNPWMGTSFITFIGFEIEVKH